MKKRRTKINLGSAPAEHRERASKLSRAANEWLLRVDTRKTCPAMLQALQNAAEEVGRADENFAATGLVLGRQRKKTSAAINMLQRKIYAAFDRFNKVCTLKVPDWSKDK